MSNVKLSIVHIKYKHKFYNKFQNKFQCKIIKHVRFKHNDYKISSKTSLIIEIPKSTPLYLDFKYLKKIHL